MHAVFGFIFVFVVTLAIVIAKDVFRTRTLLLEQYKARDCKVCVRYGTMNCPNSSLCWSTSDKPYFEPKEEDEQK